VLLRVPAPAEQARAQAAAGATHQQAGAG
jgi:hypothetical protein